MRRIFQHLFFKALISILGAIILSTAVSFVSEKVNVLERFTVAVNDIDFTDVFYQNRGVGDEDKNIVIVNIGYKDRSELAAMLKIIYENSPKVIGGSVFFSELADTVDRIGTEILSAQLKSMDNLVLASSLIGRRADGIDLIEHQSPQLKSFVKEGIVDFNIATDDPEYGTVRSFKPISVINGENHLSFGFMVASFLDSTLLQYAKQEDMMIRWYGYGNRGKFGEVPTFKTFDYDQILARNFEKAELENKIVLLGFVGESLGDYVPGGVFFSPLNKKMIGRSLPDMYGVEIHANIMKMIINKDFIYHSLMADICFNFAVLLLFAFTLSGIQKRYTKQYSLVSKVVLILFIDVFILGTIIIFSFTTGGIKFLISDGLFVLLFLPDTFEFLEKNLYSRFPITPIEPTI